jgi:hypothetical protein
MDGIKPWIITVLAVIGGYAVYQWLTGQQQTTQGQRVTANAGAFNLSLGPLGVAAGVNSNVDPTTAGVPSFDETAISNGHGDQVWAAYHNNPQSTIGGAPQYSPAFGPTENQPVAAESTVTNGGI